MTWVKCNLDRCKYNDKGTCRRKELPSNAGICQIIYNQTQARPPQYWEGRYEGDSEETEN